MLEYWCVRGMVLEWGFVELTRTSIWHLHLGPPLIDFEVCFSSINCVPESAYRSHPGIIAPSPPLIDLAVCSSSINFIPESVYPSHPGIIDFIASVDVLSIDGFP